MNVYLNVVEKNKIYKNSQSALQTPTFSIKINVFLQNRCRLKNISANEMESAPRLRSNKLFLVRKVGGCKVVRKTL